MISVIVPIYNADKYLRQCVDSILAQTVSQLEIILIDDGSTDGSPTIIDEYAAKDNRIVALHQANQGISKTQSKGIDLAKGEYIVFIDSDDYVNIDYIEQLYNCLLSNSAQCAVCNFYDTYNDNEKPRFKQNSQVATRGLFSNMSELLFNNAKLFVSPCRWNKLYLAEKLKQANLAVYNTDLIMGEDMLLNFVYFYSLNRVAYIDSPLYHYRYINTSISKQKKPMWKDYLRLYDECYRISDGNKALNNCLDSFLFDCVKIETNNLHSKKEYVSQLKNMLGAKQLKNALKNIKNQVCGKEKIYLYLIQHRMLRTIKIYIKLKEK